VNIGKCNLVMSVHHRQYSDGGVIPDYVINNIRLDEVEEIKDLGVTYDSLHMYLRIGPKTRTNASVKR